MRITINNVEAIVAPEQRIRSPVVVGMFYPEDKAEILACIENFGLKRGKGGQAQVIIVPHGAWEISGSLAGAAFASAAGRTGKKNPSRVVIMGPIHDRRGDGIFLSNSHFFDTALGKIPVDQEVSETLASGSPLFQINDSPHLPEHSLEVLLPFVKYCFPKASIVPMLMGRQREPVIAALADALKTVLGPIMESTLLVVSFNLSPDSTDAMSLNAAEECMRLIAEKNAAGFSAALHSGQIKSCGGGLVAGLLQSGLVEAMRPVPHPLVQVDREGNPALYYGALSFE
jgi:AmmeMemoRadiSam system protein B